MNFLEELVLYCAVVGTVTVVASIVIGHYKVKAAQELKACAEMPSYDDAKKSLSKMTTAICNRMYALGFPAINKDNKHEFTMLSTFGFDNNPEIIRLFRMAHAVGFEFVLRPHKEGRPGGGVEEGDEVISSTRPSDYA